MSFAANALRFSISGFTTALFLPGFSGEIGFALPKLETYG
jgi:hypothetical protein